MNHSRRPAGWAAWFFPIWIGQQLSMIGSFVARFGLIWWVTETTGSATTLATASLVSPLPGMLLGPLVGALVDRWSRRAVMIVADGVVALASAWLAYLFWADALQVWHVYVIMLVRATGNSFHWPAMAASTTLMVPEEHRPRVAGLGQTMGGSMRILSPLLGALLIELLPLHAIMIVDVATAALAIAPLLLVAVPQPERRGDPAKAQAGRPSLWKETREGLRYVWQRPGLAAFCAMSMLLSLLVTPANSFTPILIKARFGGGVAQLGWANSAYGIGMVVGGVILGAWGGFRRRVATLLLGTAGYGAGYLLVALAPEAAYPLVPAGLFLSGAFGAWTGAAATVLLQKSAGPEMQGRVFTTFGSTSCAMQMIGMVIAGPAADALGPHVPYLVGGLAQVAAGVGGCLVPALMHLEDEGRPAGEREA